MPKGKRRQRRSSWDGEASDGENNYANGTGSSANAGAFSECRRNGGDSHHTADQRDGANPRQTSTPRDNNQPRLGPWTEAVQEVVQNMGTTKHAFKVLEDRFISHMDDLTDTDETRNMLTTLKGECSRKDEKIKMLENTIAILRSMDTKAKADIDRAWAEIEKSKQDLSEEKSKQGKRVAATIAQEKLKLTNEFEKLTKDYDKSYAERRKELEDEKIRMRAENKELTATVEAQRKSLEARSEELNVVHDQCDYWKRITESYKQENQHLEGRLCTIKEELALESKPREYFKETFEGIYSGIEKLSLKYFHDIGGKDLESIHEQLTAADPYFSSIPIDDTRDSHDLRAAHAQRIISNAICEYIWKPLCSEFTLLHPEANSLLTKLSDELRNSNGGGRSANVWTALTMRGLESLPLENGKDPDISQVGSSARANKIISRVTSVLLPLVDISQTKALQEDLEKVANAAIDVWDNAQKSSELNIAVNPLLEREYKEWQAVQFHPVASDEADFDMVSQTQPGVITLFPRVVAWSVGDSVKDQKGPPGSFLTKSDQTPYSVGICIHPGRGLLECSPLVVRGKEQRKEQLDFLIRAMVDARKAAYKRTPEHRKSQ